MTIVNDIFLAFHKLDSLSVVWPKVRGEQSQSLHPFE